jgi:SAM-dependent methyltransferase
LREHLVHHLEWWGLRRFETDAAYFQWQRDTLSQDEIRTLHRLIELKRASQGDPGADIAFYDQAAAARILEVLYSQRYDYYLAIGPLIAERILPSATVLDVGCGIGILTTFYARQFPNVSFIGIDRSPVSIAVARAQAQRLGLTNVEFLAADVERDRIAAQPDCLIATHTLLQSEQDPGLPSRNWRSFERYPDAAAQASFERRTGLGLRLDRLSAVLLPHCRALIFEKTRQLSRRIPFQRAWVARGFWQVEAPVPVRYLLVEETVDDGPLYVLERASLKRPQEQRLRWNEAPEKKEHQTLHRCRGEAAAKLLQDAPDKTTNWEDRWDDPDEGPVHVQAGSISAAFEYLYVSIGGHARGLLIKPCHEPGSLADGFKQALGSKRPSPHLRELADQTWPQGQQDDAFQIPLYENHTVAAAALWEQLQERIVLKEATFEEGDGLQRHLELGTAQTLIYLYWATTLDQRQIVIVEPGRRALLEQYYEELLENR